MSLGLRSVRLHVRLHALSLDGEFYLRFRIPNEHHPVAIGFGGQEPCRNIGFLDTLAAVPEVSLRPRPCLHGDRVSHLRRSVPRALSPKTAFFEALIIKPIHKNPPNVWRDSIFGAYVFGIRIMISDIDTLQLWTLGLWLDSQGNTSLAN